MSPGCNLSQSNLLKLLTAHFFKPIPVIQFSGGPVNLYVFLIIVCTWCAAL